MQDLIEVPELKQILGAMIFAANRPLGLREMRRCLQEVAEAAGGETAVFGEVKDSNIRDALEVLRADIRKQRLGFSLEEVAGGFRLQSDPRCGTWLKHLLDLGKTSRLSRPSLETLAIIAYRQPVTRADIESIRGVSVDHVIRLLMEMQLVKIVGRSELPGRPFLYGTTQAFLEHFGLRDLDGLGPVGGLGLLQDSQAVGTRAAWLVEEAGPADGAAPAAEGEPEPDEEGGTSAAAATKEDGSNGCTTEPGAPLAAEAAQAEPGVPEGEKGHESGVIAK